MKKRLSKVLLVFFGTMVSLLAAEMKQLNITLGSLVVEEVPFKIENVSVSNESLVRVEVITENGRQVRISGLKTGITDIDLRGGGMSQLYKVTVIDDLLLKYNALRRDLDAVPEIDISMNNGRLVLKGELSSIANQELKNKVVKAYGGVILDLTTFRPTPEVMIGLHQNFEKAGFKVVRDANNEEPGIISITQVGEMLTISGSVYGPEDLKKINSILSAQPWLTVNTGNTAEGNNRVQAYVNVQVVPVMLQVDVVHLAVSRKDARAMGLDWSALVNGTTNLTMDLMYAINNRLGGRTENGNDIFKIYNNSTISGWLRIFGENNVTRARRAGFLTFRSNDANEFRRLQEGGKLVLSSNAAPGGSSQLQEFEYGLILEVKGGLTGADTVSIELKQSLSYPGEISRNTVDAKLDMRVHATTTSFTSKLGETIAIGGLKEFTQKNTNSASLPYLRNIPVFKWLISQESKDFSDDEVLTLICVHKMNASSGVDPVAVELERMKQAEDAQMQSYEEDNHKNDGKWYQFWKW